MANPAPTINQINAFNATQGTTIDFNIIGGTELVRSNRIYIYDLSDNSLICTHLYVSTESIHELPANTDGSILYADGKSSADFVNGAQYYAQIQTFTDIAGTEGGSGLSVAKMFWCLVDPTLTIDAIPSTISTTSYNVSATYDANTSVVSNIIQQYQFNLYNATGSLLQSSGVVVGNGEQQGTSTAYDISYNFTGLSVGSSYYVTVEVTTTQGMSINTQSNTFTISIDTPTLGEATVVNNACDGYISVTSNLSGEYGGSGSGEIVSFETDSENVFTKLQVDLEPLQDLHGYDAPWVGGAGHNKWDEVWEAGGINVNGTNNNESRIRSKNYIPVTPSTTYYVWTDSSASYDATIMVLAFDSNKTVLSNLGWKGGSVPTFTTPSDCYYIRFQGTLARGTTLGSNIAINYPSSVTTYSPYENICPISGHDEVGVSVCGINLWDEVAEQGTLNTATGADSPKTTRTRSKNYIAVKPDTTYYFRIGANGISNGLLVCFYDINKTFISGAWQISASITMPSNAYYIRFSTGDVYGGTYNNDISINYPSTDTSYHAYNGTTYHQDIEATYTPTVQENEAYLFKQTGDVGGDRETIELVGGTVAWNQTATLYNSGTAAGAITRTNNGDGSVTFNGTSTDVGWLNFMSQGAGKANTVYFATISNVGYLKDISSGYWTSNSTSGFVPNNNAIGTDGVFRYLFKLTQDTTANNFAFRIPSSGVTIDNKKSYVQFHNLTQMFGSTIADYIYSLEQANAGDGVAFFKSLFPKAYYPYNAGELINVKTTAHKTVGFNQWDEEWENGYYQANDGTKVSSNNYFRTKNPIRVQPSTSYYFVTPMRMELFEWGADGGYLRRKTNNIQNAEFTTSADCYYITFNTYVTATTYQNNICINISDASKNGTYEPYVENTYPLDSDLELRGMLKLDASNKLYYDGDTYKNDGSVNRKFGKVDLGTLTWQSRETTALGLFIAEMPRDYAYKYGMMGICSKYMFKGHVTGTNVAVATLGEDGCGLYYSQGYTFEDNPYPFFYVYDTQLSNYTPAQVKTAMSGVTFVYEKQNNLAETADAFEEIQKVTPIYGTEEFADSRTVPMPVYAKTQYFTRDVYGGYIDFVNGLLVVDETKRFLGKYNTWNTWGVNANANGITGFYVYANSIESAYANLREITNCEMLPIKNTAWGGQAIGTFFNMGSSTPSGWYYIVSVPNSTAGIADDDSDSVAVTKWNAFLENNPIEIVQKLAEPMIFQLTPQQIQTLVGKNNVWSEQGETSLAYHIPITNLLVKRQDVDDVSGSWLTLYSQPITQASDMDFTFIDFTNQYGKTYKYALVPLLTQTQSGVEVEVEGGYTVSDEVQSVFDGVFIVDSTGSQKCKANVGYGNVDMNQTVGTITPIGAKYPVVITNSKNQYHNGSISGTIVPDDYYFNGNLSRIDMVNKRDELEQFLTNKRVKIIKDWNGKIWLVMIMDNVSCTFNNNYGMGIVNFSTNWVEVGDPTNQQDLQETGLIDVGGV